MSVIGKYIQGGSGDWLTAKNCNIGATIDVEKIWMDEDSFPDQPPSLCVGGAYNGGEECQVRISKTNARRIAETLGEEWIGHKIGCILHMDYHGVNARGLIWEGIKVDPAEPAEKPKKQAKIKK